MLVLDELSCGACEEYEMSVANEIALETAPGRVVAIVSAAQRRYANAFARVNDVRFPLYHDRARDFAAANSIQPPMMLLLDGDDRVIAAAVPIPGRREWTRPFHALVRRQLGGGGAAGTVVTGSPGGSD